MNERIKKLRTQSQEATPRISAERALLLTEFYMSDRALQVSVPVRRALAFKHILEKKKICINDGELIVAERGPEPKAVPTYPEITLHSIEDLETLDSRKKVWFKADEETKKALNGCIVGTSVSSPPMRMQLFRIHILSTKMMVEDIFPKT